MSQATIKESFEPITDNLYKESADDDYDNPPFGPIPFMEYREEGYRRIDHEDNGINNLLADKPNNQTYFRNDYKNDTIIDDSTFDYIKDEAQKKNEAWKYEQDIKIPNFSQNFSNRFKGSKTVTKDDIQYSDDSQNDKILQDFLKQRNINPDNIKPIFNRDVNPTYNPNVLVQYNLNNDGNKNYDTSNVKKPANPTPIPNNFKEAIKMSEYHNQMYNQQLKESVENRQNVQEQSLQNWREYNDIVNKIADNYKAFYEEKTNKLKELYPEGYKKLIVRYGYSEMDNHLDNLNPKNYHKVELPNPKITKDPKNTEEPSYSVIGSYDDQILKIGNNYTDTHAYRTPYGKYLYDPSNDNIYPANIRNKPVGSLINDNIDENNNKMSEKLFKLKYKDNNESKENDDNSNEKDEKDDKEKFIDVDQKLSDIYKKILTMPINKEDTDKIIKNESWNMLYNYILFLIIILVIFILFKP